MEITTRLSLFNRLPIPVYIILYPLVKIIHIFPYWVIII